MDTRALLNGQLKLRHFVLALTIAEHGSIVRAAEHLFVTQPVISRALRELEQLLGVPLFERGARGVSPTVFAEVFLEHARAIVGHVQQAKEHIDELADATRGEVTVGTYVAGGNLLLPRAIAWLKRERPHLVVRVREATPDRLRSSLVSGDVDLVVGRLTPQRGDTPLRQIALYHEPFRIVARAGHPLFQQGRPELATLREHPWVLPVGQTALRGEFLEAFARERIAPPVEQVECSSPMTIRTMVAETDFLAIVPHTVASSDPLLRMVDLPLEAVGQTVGVTMLDDRTATPSTAFMLSALEQAAAGIRDSLRDSTPFANAGATP
ncbi:LysR family transcriptional regulator [Ruicaihuangia caeni]|uniref:LysR substrate-binding domain-containing protein n=1 Tax=Ruicaihuangia caeni TaxID=3042517 RepID=A0AAW6T5D2_9MICO|nr:LysR substrate-binding domain-containing protein [Klugiella sp. YN-L-19]MDI2099035.1 LysR substrate-binding domain-containing protein [Klugiella sp. YN-L-19]